MIWSRFKSQRSAQCGLFLLGLLTLFALVGPWISGYSGVENHLEKANLPPGSEFWFGTDELGRDLFTRVGMGARISLFVGCAAASIDLLIGIFWGGIAAFFGGAIDRILMRIADILYALPYLLVVVLLLVMMGPGLGSILVAMTIVGWITMARIVRGQVLYVMQQEYVLAAESLGASRIRILTYHILPNALGPIIVALTLTVPAAIFAEAFLSFLGLGIQAPVASWGTLASEGAAAFTYYPWRLFFPALLISLTVLSFNLIGEALREAFHVREEIL